MGRGHRRARADRRRLPERCCWPRRGAGTTGSRRGIPGQAALPIIADSARYDPCMRTPRARGRCRPTGLTAALTPARAAHEWCWSMNSSSRRLPARRHRRIGDTPPPIGYRRGHRLATSPSTTPAAPTGFGHYDEQIRGYEDHLSCTPRRVTSARWHRDGWRTRAHERRSCRRQRTGPDHVGTARGRSCTDTGCWSDARPWCSHQRTAHTGGFDLAYAGRNRTPSSRPSTTASDGPPRSGESKAAAIALSWW